TTAPVAPVFTGILTDTGSSGSDEITSDASLVLNGTADNNSTVTVTRVGFGVLGTTTANGSGDWSFDYTGTTLADNTYTFTATATDAAGNVSGVSANFLVTIDTTINAPSTPDLDPASDTGASNTDNVTTATTLLFTGTAEAGSSVTIFDGATAVGTGTATGG